jgi:hypothetical protein
LIVIVLKSLPSQSSLAHWFGHGACMRISMFQPRLREK